MHYTLRRRGRITSSVNSRVKKVSHKYGIKLTTKVKHAHKLDRINNTTFWRDTINKEIENLKVTFDILEVGAKPPPGYNKASGHLIFDARMTLERNAQWFKDGHRTPAPK